MKVSQKAQVTYGEVRLTLIFEHHFARRTMKSGLQSSKYITVGYTCLLWVLHGL